MFNGQIIKQSGSSCLYCSLIEIVSSNKPIKQSGAVEACWAHNPEVRGSKPRSARDFFFWGGGARYRCFLFRSYFCEALLKMFNGQIII